MCSSDLYFGSNLRGVSKTGQTEIKDAAESIKALPDGSTVTIKAYALNSGTDGRQRFIARERARTIIRLLKKAGATNVKYETKLVIKVPLKQRREGRRVEIVLPGYTPTDTTGTSSTTSSSTTVMP